MQIGCDPPFQFTREYQSKTWYNVLSENHSELDSFYEIREETDIAEQLAVNAGM